MQLTDGRRERGQVLVLFALFLIVLMGAAALSADYGSWLKARRDYQNAADPASLAGAAVLSRPDTPTKRTHARRAAWEELNRQLGLGLNNGQLNNLDDTNTTDPNGEVVGPYTIWVSTPPNQAGSAAGGSVYNGTQTSNNSRTVFVRVQRDNPSYFGRILGFGEQTIDAWAVAGMIPERYGVITLRKQGQAPNNISANINLNGTNSALEVVDGDVGSNWNMRLNSSSQLWVRGIGNNDAEVRLIDYISCGNSCWTVGQITSGPNGTPPNEVKPPVQIPGIINDPYYPLPPELVAAGVPNGPVIPSIPTGDPTDPSCCARSSPGSVDIGGGSDNPPGGASIVNGVLTCDAASPRIGPGHYTSITVRSGRCLILDPTLRHSSVVSGDTTTDVAQSQLPGIFYVTGSIDVNQNAMIVGDGVTLIARPNSSNQMLVSSGGVVNLNRGATPGGVARKLGAWMRNGQSPYVWDSATSRWVYNTSLESDGRNVGIAIYVIKREQYSSVAVDDNSSVIKINAGAGLAWDGITYAAHDNLQLAGQPGHDAIGQFVSWTFTFSGGTNVKQTYVGPGDTVPFLIEPRLGQ